jgi:polyribonucleotide nucleotidyltransferase
MTQVVRETVTLGGREVTFETGGIARQASAAVLVSQGDTVLLGVVSAARKPSAHMSYMPLMTDYRQKLAAAGKIPGGYGKREGRANELETLISRLVDRSIRPFFPDAWRCDTQVLISPLSMDPDCDLAVLSIAAASAALNLSDVPWSVPMAGVRVTQSGDAAPVAFPDLAAREAADLDFVASVSREGVVMLEGGAREASEEAVLAALSLASEAAAPLQECLDRLREKAGKPKRPAPAAPEPAPELAPLVPQLEERLAEPLAKALEEVVKLERYEACDAVVQEAIEWAQAQRPEDPDGAKALARDVFEGLKKKQIRAGIKAGKRLGGRAPNEIRAISSRVGWLPRAHGSALFTRGETQSVVTATLAGLREVQRLETVQGDVRQRLLLHYNFPSFSVGEVRPNRGPGRREIGHGHLARRAILGVLPSEEEFPYTIRIESTITESNGSSSMASVCGGSMALCDAGVPLPRPVAGIAMGLVREEGQTVVLSDILGDEDHVGDMDFKVAGTSQGITAIQLDNKLGSVPREVMVQALAQAREGRLHILGEMAKVLAGPRQDLGEHAPKVVRVQIEPQRIRSLIGSGGSTINGIRDELGVEIDVQDDGGVTVYGTSASALAEAKVRIHDLTGLPVLGEVITGRVTGVKHFGSFVRLFEGIEGLLHAEQLRMGADVDVKVTGVTDDGKLQLSRA